MRKLNLSPFVAQNVKTSAAFVRARRPLTVVGAQARCGVVVNGSARDAPLTMFPPEALPSAFSRLAETVRRMRTANESTPQVLSRLDREDIAQVMLGEASDG